jgi:hypothetical protein
MSGDVSYFSRFFVKFVEIIAAGLASAICAYLLAHFGGLLLSSPTPAFAPVAPTVSDVAESLRAQPSPPVVAPTVNDRRPAPQQDINAPTAQRAPQVGKDAKALPARRPTKTNASIAEKEPRDQKSAEALVRDALANVDANRRTPPDAPIGPSLTDTPSVPVDNLPPRQAIVPPQQPDAGPRPVEVPSRPAVEAVPYPDVPLQPVQSRPAPSADPPRSPDIRAAPPSTSPPLETAAPQPSPADRDNDVFSALSGSLCYALTHLRLTANPRGRLCRSRDSEIRNLHWAALSALRNYLQSNRVA